jgi:hypothetical protein
MTDTLHRSPSGARVQIDRAWACENLFLDRAHIANIFEFKDGRWSFHDAGFASGVIRCESAGYVSRELAILDAIKQWETRDE